MTGGERAARAGASRAVPARFRRARHVAGHWSEHGLELVVLATKRRTLVRERHLRILARCTDWTSLAELDGGGSGEGAGGVGVEDDVAWLLDRTLLVACDDRTIAEREARLEAWEGWLPDAAAFHLLTKDVPFVDPLTAPERIVTLRAQPPALKSHPGAPAVELPPFPRDGGLASVLRARRTWRRFGAPGAFDVERLSALCGLTWGVQAWAHFPGVRPQALKTSPSGGARHSIEVYVAAVEVRGLEAGIYHYDPDRHALELVRSGLTRDDVARYLPGQPAYLDAAAIVFQTSIFERVRWRYPHPRSYRNVLIEAGHLAQTFCLVATELGLAPFTTAALAEAELEADLGIDGLEESAVYAAGVGPRPELAWAPVPASSDVAGTRTPPAWARRFDREGGLDRQGEVGQEGDVGRDGTG